MLCNVEVLKSKQHFGRFGEIAAIHINYKTAYIRFSSTEHAQAAIEYARTEPVYTVSYAMNKFCPHWLRYEACLRPRCSHLHHPVDAHDLIVSTAWIKALEAENQSLRQQVHDLRLQCSVHQLQSEQPGSSGSTASTPTSPRQHEEDELSALKREHDRIRRKHCHLIRDFNLLQQQYQTERSHLRRKLNASVRELSGLKKSHKALQDEYLWAKHELDASKHSENELKSLLFPAVDETDRGDVAIAPMTPDFDGWLADHVSLNAINGQPDGHKLIYVRAEEQEQRVEAMEGVETEGGIHI